MARFCFSSRYQYLFKNYCNVLGGTSFRSHTQLSENLYKERATFHKTIYCEKYYSSTSGLSDGNIFKSHISEIPDSNGLLLHEYLWQNAGKWWDKTALECAETGRSYTYGQLKRLSGRLATSLRKNNLQPGDTIAAILPNVPEYAIIFLGASEAGLKLTVVNPLYTVREIKRQLVISDSKAVITMPFKYSTVTESISDNKSIKLPIIMIEDGTGPVPSGTINFKDLISDNVEEFEKTGQKTEQNPNEDAFLLPCSSGTTGLPKCIELTQRNLIMNCLQLKAEHDFLFPLTSKTHQEIVPLFLPLFHIYGISSIMNTYLSIGAKLIFMPQFSSSKLLQVLETNEATALMLVPPIIQLLINNENFTPRHMRNIRLVSSGAAPTSQTMVEELIKQSRKLFFYGLGYGLSETSPLISFSVKAPNESSGLIRPNTQLRIVGCNDEDKNKNLGINEVGEIFVKGPQVMKGYYKNLQATQECMEGEWFKTGDLGLIDDQGFLYIKGRLKELIKVQGYQVAPAELEDVILGHEKVADVAVIGVPHERYGEIPKAFIVPKPNMRIDEQELKEFVAKRVAKYKHLGHITITDTIPKSPAGKILRRELQKI
ncbi:4-coumarate--CoA ligase 1-like [Chelonus insularis]|uniref:4-coumarate--CoA ligase 1-like n=1 Tax=Chelonus insularis TaxID=460826 RepID=UPI0015893D7A|nr:4-coumarate--CoA ligase 1-like [Chelonus insularis]